MARVVQWATGNVGKQSVQSIVAHPDLELVGCFGWAPDKVGRDVGDLCGIKPTGVPATDDVEALLALKPDCVVYNPMWIDVEELVRILESGADVVNTAAFITGHSLGDERRQRMVDACERGGSSIFGSGINPGLVNLLAIVAAGGCERVDKVTVIEEADISGYDSPATEIPVGFSHPIDHPGLLAMTITDHRGRRPRLVDHQGRLRRRDRLQLARQGRRPQRRRTAICLAQRSDAGTGLADRHRAPDQGHRLPQCQRQTRYLPTAGFPGHHPQRLHAAADDPDGDARCQRDRQSGGRRTGHHHLRRHPAAAERAGRALIRRWRRPADWPLQDRDSPAAAP
jgi:hypothetical protein